MKKILIIITTQFVQYGGLTSVMMNYYRHINKSGLQIDFASTNDDVDDVLINSLDENGSKYYFIGNRKKHIFKYVKNLKKIITTEKYDVVHINGNSSTMSLELYICKKCGVPVRIAHCHTTRTEHPLINRILKTILNNNYTQALAVSPEAGNWLYTKDYIVMNNAIDPSKYFYDEKIRKNVREKLKITNAFVMGNVGKLYSAKNQKFVIDIFFEVKKIIPDSILIFVGGGVLEDELRERCKCLSIEDSVIFLGMRNDVNEIIQAFDYFVFPSLYEGFGLALIEAQASGLSCIASDAVPSNTNVTGNVIYEKLSENAKAWAKIILDSLDYNRYMQCKEAQKKIENAGFDIRTEAKKLESIYKK